VQEQDIDSGHKLVYSSKGYDMTTQLWIILISAIAPTLLALAAVITALKNGSAIKEVHLSLNSRLDELVAASKALGIIEERDKNAVVAQITADAKAGAKAQGRIEEQIAQAEKAQADKIELLLKK
jgi:hypothetical protein